MKAKLTAETTVYISCLHCDVGKKRVDHLFDDTMPREAGPWQCDDCGGKYKVSVLSSTDVEVEPFDDGKKFVKSYDLLVILPQEKPIYFIVEGGYHSPHEFEDKGKAYFYGEHTCPTNWLQSVEAIVSEGDDDPHGIAEFVRTVDVSGVEHPGGDGEPDWRAVFPEAFGDGQTIDGDLAAKAIPHE
ncbi:hypothetical protein [Mesorhizobium ventifaucium]|uniref:Uncharacterized protein n=1 Tax=Mesorhizobium ventifaucium TaxID=666020 RepID=A0ABM9DR99_9HYPH|nr:hypothetical protein [Mesorhizobium ventifaucium]CAH2399192.1 hypothetical protein MES4922_210143 [Mesorhizobium ventifaucium]